MFYAKAIKRVLSASCSGCRAARVTNSALGYNGLER